MKLLVLDHTVIVLLELVVEELQRAADVYEISGHLLHILTSCLLSLLASLLVDEYVEYVWMRIS